MSSATSSARFATAAKLVGVLLVELEPELGDHLGAIVITLLAIIAATSSRRGRK